MSCLVGIGQAGAYTTPMRALRIHLLGLLVAALALTGHSQAMARAVQGEITTIVICAGGQLATIALDAAGNPVDAQPICPECVLHVAALPPTGSTLARPVSWRAFTPVLQSVAASSVEAPSPAARGPPVDM